MVVTGPQQSGKTLCGFVIPTLYHLFEVGETVICGLPTEDMVDDKWSEDLLPVIERTRYKELLPRKGSGSRGGKVKKSVRFGNGATLRFMTGGGRDKARAGFTSRVVVITETDGLDEIGGGSREADKITQLEGRTSAFADRARIYMECTVSFEEGRTWREYQAGTQSKLAIRCPHCSAWVTPEREHLVGWQDCSDVLAAGEKTTLACPGCGATWSEAERHAANAAPKLVHRGQKVLADGSIEGEPPRTDTLGFRWTAANNLLVSQAVVGQREWKAARAANEEAAEKELRQFVWALPWKNEAEDLTQLEPMLLAKRIDRNEPRGHVPADAELLTVGIDIGKRLCHWVALATKHAGTPHVVDYGRIEVASDELGPERAIRAALLDFRDQVLAKGWPGINGDWTPAMTLIDSGWMSKDVYAVCRESPGLMPAKGFGWGSEDRREYKAPRQTTDAVALIGAGLHVTRQRAEKVKLVDVNADHWKSWVHARLRTPMGQAGAMTLFRSDDVNEHLSIAKHWTAEKQVDEFAPGRGIVVRWKAESRNNHFLDATALAGAAAELASRMKLRSGSGKAKAEAVSTSSYFGARKRNR